MNLEELKKVVEKATPGHWELAYDKLDKPMPYVYCDDAAGSAVLSIANLETPFIHPDQRFSNLAFAATFNPSLVSKLLRVVEAAKGVRTEFCVETFYQTENEVQLIAALRDLEQSL